MKRFGNDGYRRKRLDGGARVGWRPLVVALVLLMGFAGGCSTGIESDYGKVVGASGGASVDGTGVLSTMFQQAGARVRVARRLGRVVARADAIVWFPNQVSAPETETRQYLERWLADRAGRTLIYVGRGFSAESMYWRTVLETAPPAQRIEIRRQWARARVAHARRISGFPRKEDADWFAVDRAQPARNVARWEGPWSDRLDADAAEVVIAARYRASKLAEVDAEDESKPSSGSSEWTPLLASDGDVIVARFTRVGWGTSQILVVNNGSSLLNLPLVNHEHRKLAGRLIRECDGAKNVVFLESGPGDPIIASNEPNQHHGLTALTVWPVNCILIHLSVLGLILCFWKFPIFGRPLEFDEANTSDFGQHIRALGWLLRRTHDRQFAMERREYYQQRVVHHEAAEKRTASAASVMPASVLAPTLAEVANAEVVSPLRADEVTPTTSSPQSDSTSDTL